MLKRGILREGHKGGEVERWAEHRISFFLCCCFQSSPVSMATSCRRQGDSSERKGTRPLLKRMANLCVCMFVCTRGLVQVCAHATCFLYLCWKLQCDWDLHHCTQMSGLYQVKQCKCGLALDPQIKNFTWREWALVCDSPDAINLFFQPLPNSDTWKGKFYFHLTLRICM